MRYTETGALNCGLININGKDICAADSLLTDVVDAWKAYEHLSSMSSGYDARALHFERIELATLESRPPSHSYDSMLIALSADAPLAVAYRLLDTIAALWLKARIDSTAATHRKQDKTHSRCARPLIYAIATSKSPSSKSACSPLRELKNYCQELGLCWAGGLALGNERDIFPAHNTPRMGLARRARSEAIDRLIGAMRAELAVREAAEHFGANVKQAHAAEEDLIVARDLSRALQRLLYIIHTHL